MNLRIPEEFKKRIISTHGEVGHDWLLRLPLLLDSYTFNWKLKPIQPATHLSYNFVIHARDAIGNGVILKLGIPNSDLNSEINALQTFNGYGCTHLLHFSADDGVLLIEEARPGTSIEELSLNGNDGEAVKIACQVISKLHSSFNSENPAHELPHFPKPSFQTVQDWMSGFEKLKYTLNTSSGSDYLKLVKRAENLYLKMIETSPKKILLHGDLHHGNILSAKREPWLAIDPKGIIGDPAYEVGAFLRNPMPKLIDLPNIDLILETRMKLFSKMLGLDRQRIWAWSFSQSVLAAGWLIEDQQDGYENWLRLAEIILKLE